MRKCSLTLPLGRVAQALAKVVAFFGGRGGRTVHAYLHSSCLPWAPGPSWRGAPKECLAAMGPGGCMNGPCCYRCLRPLGGLPVLAFLYLAMFLMTKHSMLSKLREPGLTEGFVRGVECLLYSSLYLQDPVSCPAPGGGAQKLLVG